MIINAVCPILEYNIENLLHWYEVRSDQSWCKDKDETIYKTKCTKVMQYLEIHSGPDHEVHVKYAEILTVVFVVLMFGPGMPVLYPLAVIHYFIYYNVARYSIIYSIC